MVEEVVRFVVREVFIVSLWSFAVVLMIGGVISYAIKGLTQSGKDLIDAYFTRRLQFIREVTPSKSSSKDLN